MQKHLYIILFITILVITACDPAAEVLIGADEKESSETTSLTSDEMDDVPSSSASEATGTIAKSSREDEAGTAVIASTSGE